MKILFWLVHNSSRLTDRSEFHAWRESRCRWTETRRCPKVMRCCNHTRGGGNGKHKWGNFSRCCGCAHRGSSIQAANTNNSTIHKAMPKCMSNNYPSRYFTCQNTSPWVKRRVREIRNWPDLPISRAWSSPTMSSSIWMEESAIHFHHHQSSWLSAGPFSFERRLKWIF